MDEDLTSGGKLSHVAGTLAGKEAVTLALAGGAGVGTGAVAAGISSAGGFAAGIGGMIGVTAVSVATAAGAIISQMNYQNKRTALREMYKHEVAANLGKSPEKVTDKDIDLVAKGAPELGIEANKTIAEGLDKFKKSRNVGVLVSALSILATVAIVINFAPAIAASISSTLAGTALAEAAGYATFIAKAIIGFGVHHVLEKPISWAGKKLFDIEHTTTHERVAGLERDHKNGKALGREKVLGVFVGANQKFDQFVKERYGKQYDKLSAQAKQAVADIFEQYIPITKITESLNSGRVQASELAFSVEGKASGVVAGSVPDNLSIIGKARSKLQEVGESIGNKLQNHPITTMAAASPASIAPKRAIVEYDNPTPKRSFRDVEMERRATPNLDQSQAIH